MAQIGEAGELGSACLPDLTSMSCMHALQHAWQASAADVVSVCVFAAAGPLIVPGHVENPELNPKTWAASERVAYGRKREEAAGFPCPPGCLLLVGSPNSIPQ